MVRSNTLNTAMQNNQEQTFKTVNNLLTLQENPVEEFFEYHGVDFLAALEKLIEDTIERTVSRMLSKLEFVLDSTNGNISLVQSCLSDFEKITRENIELDMQNLLHSAVNSEVVVQRKMAKQSYLESQGFAPAQPTPQMNPMAQQNVMQGQGMGATMGGAGGAAMGVNQGMQSGYPIPPNGYDQYNNPYWLDENGQMAYSPPSSGFGMGQKLVKAAAWAKWLA
tara:strand:+ start:3017 stop:3685 length:669 start_codon:yes stop_codon:yes gene_type:complete